jgi:peptidoglycan-N-acetylglucosamine deacetylase
MPAVSCETVRRAGVFCMRCVVLAAYLATMGTCASALAVPCPGNPNALGTSRTIAIDPAQHARIGTMQYSQSPQLPLAEREVVLTFDDGPLPPYTESILRTLAAECVKATFFMVGRQTALNPEAARRVHDAGHTIGTHSQNHPLTFDTMALSRAQREIDDGIASVKTALDERAVAPFFRIPGLLRTNAVEDYLASRGLSVWSADADADDWYRTTTPESVVAKAMSRIENRGRGIILLHDIQPVTALALPKLLRELKARGYRVVHVVPQGRPAPKPPLVAAKPAPAQPERQGWPRIANADPGFQQWIEPRRYTTKSYSVRSSTRVARRPETRRTRTTTRWIYVR